jgi:hypothetical protein
MEIEGSNQYFIDYSKIKEPVPFLIKVIQAFADNQSLLAVVDTELSYEKNAAAKEVRITELKGVLDQQAVAYRVVVNKKDSDKKLLGIRLQSTEKVNVYKLGFTVPANQLNNLTAFLKENLFLYIEDENRQAEEMNDQFYEIHGEREALGELYSTQLYNDSFFGRIRINSREDISSVIKGIEENYKG